MSSHLGQQRLLLHMFPLPRQDDLVRLFDLRRPRNPRMQCFERRRRLARGRLNAVARGNNVHRERHRPLLFLLPAATASVPNGRQRD